MKLTEQMLSDLIVDVHFRRIPDSTTTIAALKLKSGFVVIGQSASIMAENFDEEVGKKIAYSNAFTKLWELEGYRVKCEMARCEEQLND